MQDLYIDGNEEGPQIIAPTDERARDILDGFRMYATRAARNEATLFSFADSVALIVLVRNPLLAVTG